jgi:hypothetical protein
MPLTGWACSNLCENFRDNSLKRDLSNDTTINPPLFSLVNTFNNHFAFIMFKIKNFVFVKIPVNVQNVTETLPAPVKRAKECKLNKIFRISVVEIRKYLFYILRSVIRITDLSLNGTN